MTKLLIVDDDEQNRYMLQVLLQGHGYEVVLTTNGAEALEMAQRDLPDMIISDILMPVMDGFALCRHCKGDEQLKNVPFVFYTATYTDPKDEEFALSLGAERFIIKPTEPDVFIEILQEVIQTHQAGQLVAPREPIAEQEVFFKEYNQALIRKLEEHVVKLKREVVERKRAEEAVRQRNRELTLLNRASRALNSTLDLDQVLVAVLEEIRRLMDVAICSIWLVIPETKELVCQQATGSKSEIIRDWRLGSGEGLAGWVVRTGESLVVPDARFDERHYKSIDPQDELGMRSILSVPVRASTPSSVEGNKQDTIGVLQAVDTEIGRFGTTDVELLESLAANAAIAIENARLYKQAQQEIIERKLAEEGQRNALAAKEKALAETLRTTHALQESEERFRNYFQLGLIGMAIASPEREWIEVNDRLCEMLGYSRAELVGDTWDKVTHPEDIAPNMAQLDRVLAGESEGFSMEKRFVRKDGEILLTSLSTRCLRRPDGSIDSFVTLIQDITDRKRAETERNQLLAHIQEQAEQLQQIMKAVPEGVLLLDTDGQIILTNPVAERELVVLAKAQVGDTITHLGDRPLAELLTSPPKGLWHEVTVDSPTRRHFEAIARPLETGPEPKGWVLVIRDVTQEREIQQHIQQQERLAAVGQLAAGIAHDFNNIMAAIVLYAQMAARAEELPHRIREWMLTINQQAQHATKLINRILDFSRRSVLERRPLTLLPLVKEQVKLLERTLPENIEIKLNYEHAALLIVNADPTRIQQVMMNLALNARDAMPEGGNLSIELQQVEIKADESPPLPEMEAGEWVKMTVSDTGMGIPSDILLHIFDPFFTTKAPGEGTGLGLAQVHGIIGSHGGHIDVESKVGQGTTFTIYLPALPAAPTEPTDQGPTVLVEGQGETILIIEDDAAARKALAESLEMLNYRALEAANGHEALEVLKQRKDEIALVLSDVVMPGMGGIALFHTLRQQGLKMPVIMLTGHSMEEELKSLRAQGMNGWLLKPPGLEQLAEIVARVLKQETDR